MGSIDKQAIANVLIKENSVTQGNYKTKGFKFLALASSTTDYDFSIPYDTEALAGEFWANQSKLGDMIEVIVAPDTIIGVVASNKIIGDTIISCSQTVLDNIRIGSYVVFASQTDEYLVKSIDKINLTITLASGLINSVSQNDYVKMSIKMSETVYLYPNINVRIGWTKIGSSYIPANTTMRIRYINTDTTDKEIIFSLDLLY